jgi:hypothetical protein
MHPLHFYFCAALPHAMNQCLGAHGNAVEMAVDKAMRVALVGYQKVEQQINAKRSHHFPEEGGSEKSASSGGDLHS